ncbi:MAG: hypothetical protein U9R56_07855 [candidate division Zixibacteria bacterium]|nr:hypothetical protein [candidate division Zixibacteria bacterium]
MEDKFDLIAVKVDQLASVVENLRDQIRVMETENADFKAETVRLQKQYRTLHLENADREETAKTKLNRILSRLEELEGLAD